MMKQVCTKCSKNLPVENFYWRNKDLGIRRGQCKECTLPTYQAYYQNNKAEHRTRTKNQRAKTREFVIEFLKNAKCLDCGNTDIRVLEFDHQRDKEADISRMVSSGCSIGKVSNEISKCDVVCANCHRIRTSISQNWKKSI